MSNNSIFLFMWGYQPYFRSQIEDLTNETLKSLNIFGAGAECFLVGVRVPDEQNSNAVCIEPEDGKWSIELFKDLLTTVEAEIETHPLQKVFYGDEPSMRDKPENIRRDS